VNKSIQECNANELIAILTKNINNGWMIASNYKQDSKEFNDIMEASIMPIGCVAKLKVLNNISSIEFKESTLDGIKSDLKEERDSRLGLNRSIENNK
jgi:hypothetical protein